MSMSFGPDAPLNVQRSKLGVQPPEKLFAGDHVAARDRGRASSTYGLAQARSPLWIAISSAIATAIASSVEL